MQLVEPLDRGGEKESTIWLHYKEHHHVYTEYKWGFHSILHLCKQKKKWDMLEVTHEGMGDVKKSKKECIDSRI